MAEKILLFSISDYDYLRKKILPLGDYEAGEIETKTFPDGERYRRIISDVRHRNVVVIGGTISDTATMELYDLAFAIQKYGAASLTLVIPYFGYSTMERAIKKGEIVTAKTRARLLSSIPVTGEGGIKVFLMDLHSEGIPHYFEDSIRPIHLYCKEIIFSAARELAGENFVLGSTDAGRAKWVESLANDMGVEAAFVLKRRVNDTQTTITSINADVHQRHVIIYDDMIRTGSSLIHAAEAYRKAGAEKISVITTHGIFVADSLKKIKECENIDCVIATDSHPNSVEAQDNFLSIKSVAMLIHESLQS